MSVSSGVITAPVRLTEDVRYVLNSGSNDLGTNCKHSNINQGSICKPISYPQITEMELKNTIDSNSNTLYFMSYSILRNMNNSIKLYSSSSNNWCFNLLGINYPAYDGDTYIDPLTILLRSCYDITSANSEKMWNYIPPSGGSSSPYRLTDFNHYDNKQVSKIICTYSTNITNLNSGIFDIKNVRTCSNANYSNNSELISSFPFPTINTFGLGSAEIDATISIESITDAKYPLNLNRLVPFLLGYYGNSNKDVHVLVDQVDAAYVGNSWYNYTGPPARSALKTTISRTGTDKSASISIPLTVDTRQASGKCRIFTIGLSIDSQKDSTYDIYKTKSCIIPKGGFFGFKMAYQVPSSLIHWTDFLVPKNDTLGIRGTTVANRSYRRVSYSTGMSLQGTTHFIILGNIHTNATTIPSESGFTSGPFYLEIPPITSYTASVFNDFSANTSFMNFYAVVKVGSDSYVIQPKWLNINSSNMPNYTFSNTRYYRYYFKPNDNTLYYKTRNTGSGSDTEYVAGSLPNCFKKDNYKYTIGLYFDIQNITGNQNAELVGFIATPIIFSYQSNNYVNIGTNVFSEAVNSNYYASPTTNQTGQTTVDSNGYHYTYDSIG